MAILRVPDRGIEAKASAEVEEYLRKRGIFYAHWPRPSGLMTDASEAHVIDAYKDRLDALMAGCGYQNADVVSLGPDTPERQAIRSKFLREHTHAEDEIRIFVDGAGSFWFHTDVGGKGASDIFCVRCECGDVIGVPAGMKHWFDCGEPPFVTAIRVFADPAGWVPRYTDSGIETLYLR
jgi:1,2-dihydroxy-3-keto-5-methylthiopentene dioxygenase